MSTKGLGIAIGSVILLGVSAAIGSVGAVAWVKQSAAQEAEKAESQRLSVEQETRSAMQEMREQIDSLRKIAVRSAEFETKLAAQQKQLTQRQQEVATLQDALEQEANKRQLRVAQQAEEIKTRQRETAALKDELAVVRQTLERKAAEAKIQELYEAKLKEELEEAKATAAAAEKEAEAAKKKKTTTVVIKKQEVEAPDGVTVVVRPDPPEPKFEIKHWPPSSRHVWVAGRWQWDGTQYVWISGRWVEPEPTVKTSSSMIIWSFGSPVYRRYYYPCHSVHRSHHHRSCHSPYVVVKRCR